MKKYKSIHILSHVLSLPYIIKDGDNHYIYALHKCENHNVVDLGTYSNIYLFTPEFNTEDELDRYVEDNYRGVIESVLTTNDFYFELINTYESLMLLKNMSDSMINGD